MQIDPLEAIIKWLTLELSSVGGRVAGKHRYGIPVTHAVVSGWDDETTGVVVRMDDGQPDLYGSTGKSRLEVRIYNEKRSPIFDVWQDLVTLSRAERRFEVVTSQGTALVHYFTQSSGFSVIHDNDLGLEVGIAFFDALIAEESVA